MPKPGAGGPPSTQGVRGARKVNRISPARLAAFRVLLRVETTSAHSDDLLHGPDLRSLSQQDRNLATALVMGVLRWQIALDAELATVLSRPEQPLPEEIRIALRIGAFQLRHMDRIPAHAALSESVELVRAAGHPKADGLVNAVLRKFAARKSAGKPIVEPIDAASRRLGHPAWIVKRWDSFYGRDATLAICEYDQHEPEAGHLFARDESAADVDPRVLDDGSRLVAELAAVAHESPRRIWDACAAPGGKTMILAQRHAAAELLATDVSAARLKSMRDRLQREMPDRVHALNADAVDLPESEGDFDLILSDVPCSGTGTLARNPEIRHRLQPEDLGRQAERQERILGSALKRLRPGGRLVYSTCSLEPEENEQVIASVLGRTGAHLRPVPVQSILERLRLSGALEAEADVVSKWIYGDNLRTLPGANFRGDGFFAAVFARTE